MTNTSRQVTAEDLYQLQQISQLEISPDGKTVVFTQSRVDKETEKKYANLWTVHTTRGIPRQFTYGDQSDTSPKWSPDGQQIAFLSNRGDQEQTQIYLIPAGGGEARQLTNLQGAIAGFDWSPNGRMILFQFRRKDPEEIERAKDERKKRLGIVARHIKRVVYKADGLGFLPNERWHIWTIDTSTGETIQVTQGDLYDETEPCWTPDGMDIVFISNRSRDPDFTPDLTNLYVVRSGGGELRQIETHVGKKGTPTVSPNGKLVAFVGRQHRADWAQNDRLWVVPFDGGAIPINLTEDHDFSVSGSVINDVGGADAVGPMWSVDGKFIYFQIPHHGRTILNRISVDSAEISVVIDDDGAVGGYSIDQSGTIIAFIYSQMSDTGQVKVREVIGGEARELTRVNRPWLDNVEIGSVEEVWIKGPVGNDLHGWIMFPPDYDCHRKYPSILEIHGGPLEQYGHAFMHEFRYLAAQGYIVTFANPRGGRGYGEDHARSIWNDNGGADYEDVMAWAGYIAGLPYIDEQRMGVTGGSYGGFMVNWIIGHTHLFSAAVTQRSIFNRTSNYGTSDMNWIRGEAFGDEAPWENVENYLRQSPMMAIGNAKTPTLIIHSEDDLRCPMEQGEQMFVALKRLGVETEMIRFPGESHGLSRNGRTDRRIVRLKHMLRWFDRYLKQ